MRGFVVAAFLAAVTLALGVVIFVAAVRTEIRRVDVTPIVTVHLTTTTVPCCAAGTGGASEGLVP